MKIQSCLQNFIYMSSGLPDDFESQQDFSSKYTVLRMKTRENTSEIHRESQKYVKVMQQHYKYAQKGLPVAFDAVDRTGAAKSSPNERHKQTKRLSTTHAKPQTFQVTR